MEDGPALSQLSGKVLVGGWDRGGIQLHRRSYIGMKFNSRLGVGTATPSAPTDVIGNAEINRHIGDLVERRWRLMTGFELLT
jgi:hypothetical protein